MKNKFYKFVSLFLVTFFVLYAFTAPVDAASKKKVGKVSINKVTTRYSDDSTYLIYTFKWKKVKGADGYQVRESYKESGTWYSSNSITKYCFYGTGGTDITDIKIKVRAYKTVKGKKKYGSWSSVKKIKVSKKKKISTKKTTKKTKKTKKSKKK